VMLAVVIVRIEDGIKETIAEDDKEKVIGRCEEPHESCLTDRRVGENPNPFMMTLESTPQSGEERMVRQEGSWRED
jgi:hypothetical protein